MDLIIISNSPPCPIVGLYIHTLYHMTLAMLPGGVDRKDTLSSLILGLAMLSLWNVSGCDTGRGLKCALVVLLALLHSCHLLWEAHIVKWNAHVWKYTNAPFASSSKIWRYQPRSTTIQNYLRDPFLVAALFRHNSIPYNLSIKRVQFKGSSYIHRFVQSSPQSILERFHQPKKKPHTL